MKQYALAASLVLSALTGCAASTPAAEPTSLEITRDAAVAAARRDAASHFNVGAPSAVMASRSGRYWIVDLRAPDGGGLHYAIAVDGTIRERRMLQ